MLPKPTQYIKVHISSWKTNNNNIKIFQISCESITFYFLKQIHHSIYEVRIGNVHTSFKTVYRALSLITISLLTSLNKENGKQSIICSIMHCTHNAFTVASCFFARSLALNSSLLTHATRNRTQTLFLSRTRRTHGIKVQSDTHCLVKFISHRYYKN